MRNKKEDLGDLTRILLMQKKEKTVKMTNKFTKKIMNYKKIKKQIKLQFKNLNNIFLA